MVLSKGTANNLGRVFTGSRAEEPRTQQRELGLVDHRHRLCAIVEPHSQGTRHFQQAGCQTQVPEITCEWPRDVGASVRETVSRIDGTSSV